MGASGLRTLAIANQKGGVGKTTTAINLGTALASIGERVLVLDLDAQGNASTGLGIDRDVRSKTTFDVLTGAATLIESSQPTAVPGLYAVPANADLVGIDATLGTDQNRATLNPSLEIQGVVLTMHDARTSLSREVAENVRAFFGTKVYETIIPRNTRVAEAPSHGKPILLYDYDCAGSQAYIKLAIEIIERERQYKAA
jgi:cellulose biosynthesis protein BcsQ